MKLEPAHYALFTLFLVGVYCLGHYLSPRQSSTAPTQVRAKQENSAPISRLQIAEEDTPLPTFDSQTILNFVQEKSLDDAELIVAAVLTGKRNYESADQAGYTFNIKHTAKGGSIGEAATIYLHFRDEHLYSQLIPENNKEFVIVYAGFNRYKGGDMSHWRNASCLADNSGIWLLSWMQPIL